MSVAACGGGSMGGSDDEGDDKKMKKPVDFVGKDEDPDKTESDSNDGYERTSTDRDPKRALDRLRGIGPFAKKRRVNLFVRQSHSLTLSDDQAEDDVQYSSPSVSSAPPPDPASLPQVSSAPAPLPAPLPLPAPAPANNDEAEDDVQTSEASNSP